MRRLPGRRESAGKPATRHWPVNRPCPASAGNAESRLQPRVTGRILSLLVLCSVALLAARALPAQAIGQGFELERAGQYDQAAAIYLATLRAEPTNLSALLGLERVLPPINRLGDLLPAAQRAAAASPSNVALRGVLLRTYVALNEPDSGRAVALRWAAAAPGDEAPYREWAMALEDAHRHGPARDVLLLGRRALGRPGAFGIELAELSQLSGDWEGAAREWAAALTDAPVQLPNAASALAEAPDAQRERIARLLTGGTRSTLTRRLAGELLLNWGQPLRAWAVFEPSVATPSADAAFAARRFADLAGARSTPDARRARALALARYADLAPEVGGAAARARADAARAFIEAGDRVAARRGRGPDRGGTAQRGSAAAGDQCPAVPQRPRQPTPPAGARPNCGRRVGPRRHGAGARLERRGTRAAGVDRPVSREVERGPAVVSRRGAVRRRPTRRRRPHHDGRPAAAGPA